MWPIPTPDVTCGGPLSVPHRHCTRLGLCSLMAGLEVKMSVLFCQDSRMGIEAYSRVNMTRIQRCGRVVRSCDTFSRPFKLRTDHLEGPR